MSTNKYPLREKKHRLDPEVYKGELIVSFTACVKHKNKIFINDNLFNEFEDILITELKYNNCSSYVYLFMPDHLHLIICGEDAHANVKICMDRFKQKTGFWMSQHLGKSFWQKDYYDHILRSSENLTINIKYILNNPVRAGIVNYWKQYPYKGSTIFDLEEWD